jgi:hypothetical protein
MTLSRRLLGLAMAMAVPAAVLQAQSPLGEIARKEQERRKAVAAPGKVYTNETLRVPPLPPLDPDAPERAPAPADPATAAERVPAGTDAPAAGEDGETAARGEAYWRARVQEQRDALRRAEMFAEALQTRINALTADFTARDDPAQRDLIALDRQRTLAELDRLREEIAAQAKAIAATEEDARRAGVPPGWLR